MTAAIDGCNPTGFEKSVLEISPDKIIRKLPYNKVPLNSRLRRRLSQRRSKANAEKAENGKLDDSKEKSEEGDKEEKRICGDGEETEEKNEYINCEIENGGCKEKKKLKNDINSERLEAIISDSVKKAVRVVIEDEFCSFAKKPRHSLAPKSDKTEKLSVGNEKNLIKFKEAVAESTKNEKNLTRNRKRKRSKSQNNLKNDNRRMTGNVNIYICSEKNDNVKYKKTNEEEESLQDSESSTDSQGSASTVSISTSKLLTALKIKQQKNPDDLDVYSGKPEDSPELTEESSSIQCSETSSCSRQKDDSSDTVNKIDSDIPGDCCPEKTSEHEDSSKLDSPEQEEFVKDVADGSPCCCHIQKMGHSPEQMSPVFKGLAKRRKMETTKLSNFCSSKEENNFCNSSKKKTKASTVCKNDGECVGCSGIEPTPTVSSRSSPEEKSNEPVEKCRKKIDNLLVTKKCEPETGEKPRFCDIKCKNPPARESLLARILKKAWNFFTQTKPEDEPLLETICVEKKIEKTDETWRIDQQKNINGEKETKLEPENTGKKNLLEATVKNSTPRRPASRIGSAISRRRLTTPGKSKSLSEKFPKVASIPGKTLQYQTLEKTDVDGEIKSSSICCFCSEQAEQLEQNNNQCACCLGCKNSRLNENKKIDNNEKKWKTMVCIYCDNRQDNCECLALIERCQCCELTRDICDCQPEPWLDKNQEIEKPEKINGTTRKLGGKMRNYSSRQSEDVNCHCQEKAKPYGSDKLPYQNLNVFSNVMSELRQKITDSICCDRCSRNFCGKNSGCFCRIPDHSRNNQLSTIGCACLRENENTASCKICYG